MVRRGTDLCFVKWHAKCGEFWPITRKSQNFHFNGLLLTKVYNVWAKQVQKSYVLWLWRVIQRKDNSWEIYIFCAMNYTRSSQRRHSQTVGKIFDNCVTDMDEFNFEFNLYSFTLILVPQENTSFPKVSYLLPPKAEQLPKISPSFSVNPSFLKISQPPG